MFIITEADDDQYITVTLRSGIKIEGRLFSRSLHGDQYAQTKMRPTGPTMLESHSIILHLGDQEHQVMMSEVAAVTRAMGEKPKRRTPRAANSSR